MRKKAVLPITKTRLFKYNENFTIKNENFQMKNSGSFHSSAQNIYCGYLLEPPTRGGSNEYSQSMFLNRNKKINVYPCKPQFYCIKWGLGGQNYMFSWWITMYRNYPKYLHKQDHANSIDPDQTQQNWV